MSNTIGIRRDVVITRLGNGSVVVYKWDLMGDASGRDGWVLIPDGAPGWPVVTQDADVLHQWISGSEGWSIDRK